MQMLIKIYFATQASSRSSVSSFSFNETRSSLVATDPVNRKGLYDGTLTTGLRIASFSGNVGLGSWVGVFRLVVWRSQR
jgi:homoserine acetyltransferase